MPPKKKYSPKAENSTRGKKRKRDDEETVDADTAASKMIKLLPKINNYSIGVCSNGDLIITKVNGATSADKGIADLGKKNEMIAFRKGRSIYLAQKFNTQVGSNHAEMCILAAAEKLGLTVTKIYCTGPHCAFCAAMMKTVHADLGTSAKSEDQMGWAHPFSNVFYGQQSTTTKEELKSQLTELEKLPKKPKRSDVAPGNWTISGPNGGKATKWF